MTKSTTQLTRTKATRLAILRELHETGKIRAADYKQKFVDWMVQDGTLEIVKYRFVVTKAGLTELAEASRCSP